MSKCREVAGGCLAALVSYPSPRGPCCRLRLSSAVSVHGGLGAEYPEDSWSLPEPCEALKAREGQASGLTRHHAGLTRAIGVEGMGYEYCRAN